MKNLTERGYSFFTFTERVLVRNVKEKMCYTALRCARIVSLHLGRYRLHPGLNQRAFIDGLRSPDLRWDIDRTNSENFLLSNANLLLGQMIHLIVCTALLAAW